MDIVYYAVDSKIEYCELLLISIESLINTGYKGDIGIICDKQFRKILSTELNNTEFFIYEHKSIRSTSKLRLFEFDVSKYERFIFLDADTIVAKDISPLFDLIDDKICVAGAGHLLPEGDPLWYGAQILNELEMEEYSHLQSINSGVFGFKHDQIPKLKEIYEMSLKDESSSKYCEQPCFNVHLMRNNNYCYSYNGLVYHGMSIFAPDAIIYHFAGGVGNFEKKYENMKAYYSSLKALNYGNA